MTTMTKAEKTKAPAPKIVAGEGYKEIGTGLYAIEHIEVQSNFRKTFNEKLLKELAGNIAKVGVLQPIIVRRGRRPSCWFLVAGERRLRAAQMAGLKEIPARELELTDEQALEVQALENLHRKDLSPIEEARAFKVLLDQKGHTLEQVQDLADRVGKSVNYVYRAVRLLELPKNVLEKIESGEWTPAHGHQLLRVPADKIEEIIENSGDTNETTATDIRDTIDNQLGRKLDGRPFPKNVPYADKEACTVCVYNSGNQGQLFDGAEKGNCTNRACLDAKMEYFKAEKIESMTAKHGENFLGFKDEYSFYDGERVDKGHVVLGKVSDKKTKDAQKKGCKYVMDRELTVYAVVERPQDSSRGSSGEPARITPKQKFVRMETYKALFQACRNLVKLGLEKSPLTVIAKALEPSHYDTKIPDQIIPVKRKGGPNWNPSYDYDELDQAELLALCFMRALDFRNSLSTQDPDPKRFDVCGLDSKKIIAKAKKDAEAAWDAQKGKKPAKAAK